MCTAAVTYWLVCVKQRARNASGGHPETDFLNLNQLTD